MSLFCNAVHMYIKSIHKIHSANIWTWVNLSVASLWNLSALSELDAIKKRPSFLCILSTMQAQNRGLAQNALENRRFCEYHHSQEFIIPVPTPPCKPAIAIQCNQSTPPHLLALPPPPPPPTTTSSPSPPKLIIKNVPTRKSETL